MARLVIASNDEVQARTLAEMLVLTDVSFATGPHEAAELTADPDTVLLVDAGTAWADALVRDLPEERPAIVLVVADPETLHALPTLMRMGADAFVTLPTDRIVLEAAVDTARQARARARAERGMLESARAQLMRFAEDFKEAYRAERERAQQLADSLDRLERSYKGTVQSLAKAVESKDVTTGRHIERVTNLALKLARRVDPELASEPYLAYGFLLHDVGKIGVPDDVLTKGGPLDDVEWRAMREHPVIGARIVEGVEFLKPVHAIILHHHERWDGLGYPDRLAGEEIPVAARIFSVADAADAMMNDRPYRKALPLEQVRTEIQLASGNQFDPAVVEAFTGLLDSEYVRLRD